MVEWSSFLLSEWFGLLFSVVKVTIVLEPYRRKWQGGNIYRQSSVKNQLAKQKMYLGTLWNTQEGNNRAQSLRWMPLNKFLWNWPLLLRPCLFQRDRARRNLLHIKSSKLEVNCITKITRLLATFTIFETYWVFFIKS